MNENEFGRWGPVSSFDFCFSKSLIEHLHDPMMLIEESHRILRKDGVGIFIGVMPYNGFVVFFPEGRHEIEGCDLEIINECR